MITPEGVVKVLDFGLAAYSPAREGEASTVTTSPTRPGVIMGTAAYMSPEQARGEAVDKRTDIWAYGVVLWEMLTGRQMFTGATTSDVLSAVLTKEPDLQAAPEKVRLLLGACLEKDPRQRLRDIGDAQRLREHPPVGDLRHKKLPWAVAAAAVLVAAVGWWFAIRPASSHTLVRLDAEIAAGTPLAPTAGSMFALSPNGARLALVLRGADGKALLHTRLLHQNQVTPLAGTENAYSPFFSPDGEWIGFFADGKLKKVSVEGGVVVTLCDAPDPDGASWGDDGNIIATLDGAHGLWRLTSSGGTPVPLTKLNPGEVTHRWPQLPGSQAVVFTAHTRLVNYDDANIDVVSLKTGERKTVLRGGFFPRYLATSNSTGHLVYLHQSTLFAVPFRPGRLALAGVPAPILEDVVGNAGEGGEYVFAGAPSEPGTFVYLAGKGQLAWPISWVDSMGKTQPMHTPAGVYWTPRFSPDGKRLAFSMGSSQGENIWVLDLDRDTPSRVSFLAGQNMLPTWTLDGKNLVFRSTNPGAPGLYWVRSDGSGEALRLTNGELDEFPYSFSPDGKRLAFSANGNGGSQDIFTAPIEGDLGHVHLGKELFLGTPFNEIYPAFSPDGRWLAYSSNESGTMQVYVRPFPGPGGRWQISTGGGLFPLWSRDGRELLFENSDQRVMAAGYSTKGDSLALGKLRVWSESRLRIIGALPFYDLAPDGKHLAAILASGDAPTHLTVLLNFFDELRRRVPVGGK